MKNDAIKNGVRPRRGMYIISPSRRRAYGPILSVHQLTIRWQGSMCPVHTDHSTIVECGDYEYADSVPAGFELWRGHA